jgi:hypothetical protein
MGDRQKHDLAYAITWGVFELTRDRVPSDEQRDFFDEVYTLTRNEIDIHDRLAARQEARLKPVRRVEEGG